MNTRLVLCSAGLAGCFLTRIWPGNSTIHRAMKTIACSSRPFFLSRWVWPTLLAALALAAPFVSQAEGARAREVLPESTIQSFSNSNVITINDNTTASPYPSTITVSGVNPAVTTRVEVFIFGLFHTFPDDIDMLLVGPQGQRLILMSDAGGDPDVSNVNLRFTPTATATLPDNAQIVSGIYRPVNYEATGDVFPAPGPGTLHPLEPTDLNVFSGTNPNGVWSLYVVDDAAQDTGIILNGWSLSFTVPQVFTVTKTADTNDGVCDADCSLREALALAQDGDLINFSSLFITPQTINLLTALPDITKSVTIQGTGANLLTVRRDFNAADFTVFNIAGGVTSGVTISGMTISNGRDVGGAGQDGFGGGIDSVSNLTLTNVHVTGNTANTGGGVALAFADGVFTNCTFSNNTAADAGGGGGGIFFQGDSGRTLRLVSSTVSGNHSANSAGGIDNVSTGNNSRLEITNSTITGNTALSAGGIETFTQGGGTTAITTLRNTVIAGNSPNNLATGTFGGGAATFETQGFNLSDNYNGVFAPLATDITTATPRLAPLALYGGQTPTHALFAGSPAINAGESSGSLVDQRGRPRVFGVSADIGAVEMQSFIVTNTNDSGAGSLRQAIADAPTNSDILFAVPLFNSPQTVTLTTGELVINRNLNIIGPGANLLTISGANQSRVFQVASGFTASLSGMTITGGNANGDGGGIFNGGILTVSNSFVAGNTSQFNGGGIGNGIGSGNFARLTVNNSTISGNVAPQAGGINTDSITDVSNSTISGNISQTDGGGIFNSGSLTITNSTITNNSAAGTNSAGGVRRFGGGTVNIRNSIIAGNVNNATQPDVVASGGTGITSNGFNLIGNRGAITFNQTGDQSGTGASPLNPLLGALQNNGGTTPTHALLAGSPALDKGDSSGFTSDQRGSRRPFDLSGITNVSDGADIGAFELRPLTITSIVRLPNGHILLQGSSEAGNAVTLQAAPDPNPASFSNLMPPATADASGLWQYDDAGAIGQTKRFYRATLP